MSEPFLHIRCKAGGFEVEGMTEAKVGHKIYHARRSDFDGIFAEWTWDGSRLRVHNDRYGFYPLYYFANSEEIAISTSIVRLLRAGASPVLDDAALAAFLRLGSFLGEDTAFQAIRALPPSATLEWRNGELEVSGHITITKADSLSRDAAIDGYISLFRAAIRRRQPSRPNIAVTLSGGRDSRHILLELCEQGLRPDFCLTARGFPAPTAHDEVEVATGLCHSLGLPHLTLDQPESLMQAVLNKNLKIGFCTFEHNWYQVVADHLNRTAVSVYDGIGGDVLSAGLFLSPERVELCEKGDLAQLADDLFVSIPDRAIEGALRPELAHKFNREVALARFAAEFRRHADAPNPVGSFYFWNRTRRVTSLCPYGMLREPLEVFSPYLDHELFDLLASLPAKMLVDHSFHTETIQRAYPAYAHIPYAQSNNAGAVYRKHYRSFALSVARYLFETDSHQLLRGSYFQPRLFRCLIDPGYLPSAIWIGVFALFLAQLEMVVQNQSPAESYSEDLRQRSRGTLEHRLS
ncbi:MAG: asparagine synthase-related protein [Acidobacteria bacterium]|nr:asparagine synthase-related protein [Acidobacteriota bacterium]